MREKDRRDQILQIAEELFAEKGYNKASMREIAERLGVKKPSLYHHFHNKEEIYYTIIAGIYQQVLDEMAAFLDRGETIEEMIRLSFDRMIDLWSKHPNYPRILVHEMTSGRRMFTTEIIPNIGKPRFDEAIEKYRRAGAGGPGYRDVDIPMLLLIAFNIPLSYFFSSQISSIFLGKDCLSPEMIKNFKRELSDLFAHGVRDNDK
jgi:AcrR family transcriptional regulator